MNRKKTNINLRVVVLYLLTLLISIIVVLKILTVQHLKTEINTNSQPKYFSVDASRGNIVSDDGSLLAISMPLYNVRLDMSVMNNDLFLNNVDSLSYLLSELFNDKSHIEYKQFLLNSKNKKANKFILLKKKVTHIQLNELKKMPIFNLGQNKGGLIAIERPNRINPYGLLAKRTIGKLRDVNPVGIERAYNQQLSGRNGLQLKRKIDRGVWVPQESKGDILPSSGNNILTTINVDMQDVAEKSLQNALIENNADWGCIVMMEVATGEIKVIANLKKDTNDRVSEAFNFALAQHISPGSTFKIASVIAGLEDDKFNIYDTVNIEGGRTKFYDRVMIDSDHNYKNITIKDAFSISSNVAISKIINNNYKDNPEQYTDRIYQMGLSKALDLELPYPNNLKMPIAYKKSWSGVTLPWMSIGYEMQLTPIHILAFYNAIANKGRMIKPIFVSSINKGNKVIEKFSTEVINPAICSNSTIDKVHELLVAVVEQGTAQNIKTDKYLIAGKTGTTVLNYSNRKKDEAKKYRASFVGYFPASNPKYTCIVVVSNPKKSKIYGGQIAAPIFKELSDKVFAMEISMQSPMAMLIKKNNFPKIQNGSTSKASIVLDYLNIDYDKTDGEYMISELTDNTVKLKLRKIKSDLQSHIMPSLIGMNLSDVIYLLENHGLKVKFNGYGSVVNQSIKKGERFQEGSVIKIKLS
tara:strand:- start:3049 stop:5136 length:2088 start_codon:yes stop_codon:yes gene_type:complete